MQITKALLFILYNLIFIIVKDKIIIKDIIKYILAQITFDRHI